jgi:aspartate/methionine/tyrosine aminotransferase
MPGMWERTISIYSAGKAFSITGVKVYFFENQHFLSALFMIY